MWTRVLFAVLVAVSVADVRAVGEMKAVDDFARKLREGALEVGKIRLPPDLAFSSPRRDPARLLCRTSCRTAIR